MSKGDANPTVHLPPFEEPEPAPVTIPLLPAATRLVAQELRRAAESARADALCPPAPPPGTATRQPPA